MPLLMRQIMASRAQQPKGYEKASSRLRCASCLTLRLYAFSSDRYSRAASVFAGLCITKRKGSFRGEDALQFRVNANVIWHPNFMSDEWMSSLHEGWKLLQFYPHDPNQLKLLRKCGK